jgi:hypothetical protein
LVDANVLSEPARQSPNPAVVAWLGRNVREIAVDPIILGEIRFGILILPRGRRRSELEGWFELVVQRILCVGWGPETGLRWAQLLASLRRGGKAMPIKDSLIAATALVHELTVVTRNHTDFEGAGVRILNPFAA